MIGADAPPEIHALAGKNIEIIGFVPDVAPYFEQARLSVAPLRFGAGVKGKVNQSMALGVPAVVTSMAAEGMHLVHEENAMIADDPERFADAIVRVWTSAELWQRLSDRGRENVREHFSVEAASRHIDNLLSWAGLDGFGELSRPMAHGGAFRPAPRRRGKRKIDSPYRSPDRIHGVH